ncbi:M23 family metallopeptidase [Solwaraspora sp. WMMD937]|uniref:M23 family metallopeptidase n=1 Tax=Solwaraspora sp. WMMD937 TaxID=3016090 RepID=UPI00249B2761|nr:M23 family metallopeptidase [Solwaraspora sp. WMMD937]WFE19244.1 M23 family metallopeptidase [Solwaraspora sp. WMMD937]
MRFLLLPMLVAAILFSTAPAVPATMSVAAPGPQPTGFARPAADPRFHPPLAGTVTLSRRFDPPPVPWGRGHRGVDLTADVGATVYTAGAGTVSYSGRIVDRGVVSISHPGGFRTTYEPVDGWLAVGTAVSAGRPIGTVTEGHPGCPADACLHWGLRLTDGSYLDPLLLLGNGRVRLLALGSAGPA